MAVQGSARFKLGRQDLGKLSISFALSAGGALLMTILEFSGLIDWNSASWGPLAGAMVPFLVNFLRKALTDSRPLWAKARDRNGHLTGKFRS